MYNKIIYTLIRIAITWLMGALASHLSKPVWTLVNDVIIQIGGPEALVVAIGGTAVVALATLWTRISAHLHFITALRLPKNATVADAKLNSPGVIKSLIAPPIAPK